MKDLERNCLAISGRCLVVKDIYDPILDRETEEKIGIMNELPDIKILDIWCEGKQRYPHNWYEYMYNNPFAPFADYNEKKDKLMSYIDGSGANQTHVIGSMKEIWIAFERDEIPDLDFNNIKIKDLERRFWRYYMDRYKNNFENGVKILEAYIAKKRAMMTEEQKARERAAYPFLADEDLWQRGCRDYLEYLIKIKTVRGFIVEMIFFMSIAKISGGSFMESSREDEKKGIDGYSIVGNCVYPVCLKPSSSKGTVSGIYWDRYVEYRRRGNDLVFYFSTGVDLLAVAQLAAEKVA